MESCAKLLYGPSNVDITGDTLISISRYMLTVDTLDKLCENQEVAQQESVPTILPKESPIPEPVLPEPAISKKVAERRFTPKQENTLFWCMYIAQYGYSEYMRIGTRYNNAEIDEKQAVSADLNKHSAKLKSTNFKLSNQSIQEICSAITVCRKDGLFSLIAFCAYYKKTVFVVFSNRTYLMFSPEKEATEDAVMIHCETVGKRNNQVYSLTMDVMPETIREMRDTHFRLDHYEKPLRSASAYKLDELVSIATKLGVSIGDKPKKADVYEKVAIHCSLERMSDGR